MKDTIILENPVKINGQEVTELTYDAEEITALQFSEACGRSAAVDKTKSVTFKLRENDYALHLYLGFMAVIAVNPSIDITDLERVKGQDILHFANIGMLFTLGRLGGHSEENSLEEPSESTADTSIAALPKSAE